MMDPIAFNVGALEKGTFVGRVWREERGGPSIVRVNDGDVFDVTSKLAPTIRDLCEQGDPAGFVRNAKGEHLGAVGDLLRASIEPREEKAGPYVLAPVDLQVLKAAGVTFAHSMLERVIEEQAKGDPALAEAIRGEVRELVGDLSSLKPGSDEAMALKASLVDKGVWSQYLEVGIGPDPEIFTKAPVLSAVGFGAHIGIHPVSRWNNPEPEVAVIVSGKGRIVGATLGNDVNLRDVEGRSALLLSKAKDNNASCALGPFIRLFDDSFGLEDVSRMEIRLFVEGQDGFTMAGANTMSEISRSPSELVEATINDNHAYPDGFVLMLGTLFAPTQDRDTPGQGFTHKTGDTVSISSPELGVLYNSVRTSDACTPWNFSASHLMRNLAARELL